MNTRNAVRRRGHRGLIGCAPLLAGVAFAGAAQASDDADLARTPIFTDAAGFAGLVPDPDSGSGFNPDGLAGVIRHSDQGSLDENVAHSDQLDPPDGPPPLNPPPPRPLGPFLPDSIPVPHRPGDPIWDSNTPVFGFDLPGEAFNAVATPTPGVLAPLTIAGAVLLGRRRRRTIG